MSNAAQGQGMDVKGEIPALKWVGMSHEGVPCRVAGAANRDKLEGFPGPTVLVEKSNLVRPGCRLRGRPVRQAHNRRVGIRRVEAECVGR